MVSISPRPPLSIEQQGARDVEAAIEFGRTLSALFDPPLAGNRFERRRVAAGRAEPRLSPKLGRP